MSDYVPLIGKNITLFHGTSATPSSITTQITNLESIMIPTGEDQLVAYNPLGSTTTARICGSRDLKDFKFVYEHAATQFAAIEALRGTLTYWKITDGTQTIVVGGFVQTHEGDVSGNNELIKNTCTIGLTGDRSIA